MAAYASQPKQHAEDGNHQGQNLVDFGYRKVAEEDKARMGVLVPHPFRTLAHSHMLHKKRLWTGWLCHLFVVCVCVFVCVHA